LRLAGPALQRRRKSLVLDTEQHRYDETLSDISGMIKAARGRNRKPARGLARLERSGLGLAAHVAGDQISDDGRNGLR
jgi:hypothetical protein